MIGTETVLTLFLYQAQTDERVGDVLFGKQFTQSSLLLNAIQAQIELMTDTIFDEQARWELITLSKKECCFISISPSTVNIYDLAPWHAAGFQASINVFGDHFNAISGKQNLVESLQIHINSKPASQVA
ncbi:MAG: hypothetical protein ACJAU1_000439 [Psychromonas sp.]|jgi:hypothetical protein